MTKVKEVIKTVNSIFKKEGMCDKFADSLAKKFDNLDIPYEKIKIESTTKYIPSKKYDSIGTNGFHYGIKVGDVVYDNFNYATGMNFQDWLDDMGYLGAGDDLLSWHIVS
ncbi:MAG: hypothetical protein LBM93_01185 [Oscillospiraceae bacterium]|nr:hypothetical protein [Oscillospiraceae bacterium]